MAVMGRLQAPSYSAYSCMWFTCGDGCARIKFRISGSASVAKAKERYLCTHVAISTVPQYNSSN